MKKYLNEVSNIKLATKTKTSPMQIPTTNSIGSACKDEMQFYTI